MALRQSGGYFIETYTAGLDSHVEPCLKLFEDNMSKTFIVKYEEIETIRNGGKAFNLYFRDCDDAASFNSIWGDYWDEYHRANTPEYDDDEEDL